MRIALSQAFQGAKKGAGGPFGCCIVKGNRVIAKTHNTVLKKKDPTAHAEINAIVKAAKALRKYDLSDCVLYATTEPCPMCFSAIHWARLQGVIYGTEIKEVAKLGFNELSISAARLKKLGKSGVKIKKGFLYKECKKLLEFWETLPVRKAY